MCALKNVNLDVCYKVVVDEWSLIPKDLFNLLPLTLKSEFKSISHYAENLTKLTMKT